MAEIVVACFDGDNDALGYSRCSLYPTTLGLFRRRVKARSCFVGVDVQDPADEAQKEEGSDYALCNLTPDCRTLNTER